MYCSMKNVQKCFIIGNVNISCSLKHKTVQNIFRMVIYLNINCLGLF